MESREPVNIVEMQKTLLQVLGKVSMEISMDHRSRALMFCNVCKKEYYYYYDYYYLLLTLCNVL